MSNQIKHPRLSQTTTTPHSVSSPVKRQEAVEICEASLFPRVSNRKFRKNRIRSPRKMITTPTPWGERLEFQMDSDDLDPTVSPSELNVNIFQFEDGTSISYRTDGNIKLSKQDLFQASGPLTTIRVQEIVQALARNENGKKSNLFKATPQSGLLSSLFGFPHEDVIEDLMDECQQLRNVVDRKIPEVSSYAEMLKMFNDFSSSVNSGASSKAFYQAGLYTSFGVAIGCSTYYYRTESSTAATVGCGALCVAIYCSLNQGLGLEIIQGLMSMASSFFPDEARATPQAGIDTAIDSLAVLATAVFGVTSNNVSVLKMLGNIKEYAKCRQSLQDIVKNVVTAFQNCYNSICQNIPGMRILRLLSTDDGRVDQWISEVDQIFDIHNTGELLHSVANLVLLDDVIRLGESLSSEFRKEKFGQSICTTLRLELKKLKELRGKFLSYRVTGDGSRAEPSCLMLRGGPGIFKSVLIERLADLLVRDSLVSESAIAAFEEDKRAYIWATAVETGYDDGYTPTTIVQTQDDFGQGNDIAGNLDNEYMKAIRRNCGFPCLLHPADVKDKGTLYFKAKYCLATTNRQEFSNLPSIKNSKAFLRRWDLDIIASVKQQYCTDATVDKDIWSREADVSRLPVDEFGSTIIHEDIWEFHVIKEDGGNITQLGVISYLELVKRVISVKNRKEREYHSNQRSMQSMNRATLNTLYGRDNVIAPTAQVGIAEIQMEHLHRDHITAYSRDQLDRIIDLIDFCKRVVPDWDPTLGEAEDTFRRFFGERDYTLYVETNSLDLLSMVTEDHVLTMITVIPGMPITRQTIWNTAGDIIGNIFANDGLMHPELRRYHQVTVFFAKCTALSLAVLCFSSMFGLFRKKKKKNNSSPQSIGISDRLARVNLSSSKVIPQSMEHSDRLAKVVDPTKVVPQMGNFLDPNGYKKVISDFGRNSYVVQMFAPSGKMVQRIGNLNFIRGSQALVPYHYVTQLLSEVEDYPETVDYRIRISKTSGVRSYEFMVSVKEFLSSFVPCPKVNENQDLAMLDFGYLCHSHRDITENFALNSDLSFLTRTVPFIMLFSDEMPLMVPSYASSELVELPVFEDELDTEPSYKIHKAFTYRLSTVNGDCGALMAVMNPALAKRKYFGIHVAGHEKSGVGYSSLVTQEILREYFGVMRNYVKDVGLDLAWDEDAKCEPQFKMLGRVNPSPSHNVDSDIRPSFLHGNFGPVVTGRAMLSPFVSDEGEMIDPYHKAATKYCNPSVWIDPDILQLVEDNVFCFVKDNLNIPVSHRLLSWEECLYGIDSDIDSRGLPPSTSAGFPMTCSGYRNLKKDLYSKERGSEEWMSVFNEIVTLCEKAEADLLDGIRNLYIYTDNLKDERRPLEKVKAGSTRLFSGCPFIYLILKKRYFGTFILEFQKNRIFNSSCVGVNPFSAEWDLMARRLGKFSLNKDEVLVGAGDYEKFDGSQLSRIHHSILRVINRCYGDEHSFARQMLWMEVVSSRHVYKGVVVEWCSAMPSGNLLTILINCFYNMYAFRFSWYYAGLSLSEFSSNVELFVVGDDNIFSVHPKFHDLFNEITICQLMKNIGLSYTLETKGLASEKFRLLTEVEFLKRSFRFDSDIGRFIAPLRLSVVLDIPNWTKKSSPDLIAVDNIEECSRELSLHPRSIFQRYNSQLIVVKDKFYVDFKTKVSLHMSYLQKKKLTLALDQYFPC